MASHLTLQERERVSQMVHAHRSQAEIARRLKRHPATISRELRRNRSPNGYWAASAQTKAEARRRDRPRICKMQRPEVANYVRERAAAVLVARRNRRAIAEGFSRQSAATVSRQTIYAWIHAQRAAGAHWHRYLRRLGRVRRRSENRGQLAACVSIEGRPAVVDRRARYGDWEGDTVVGRGTPGRRRHTGRSEIRLPAAGQGRRPACLDRATSDHGLDLPLACGSAENADIGQRQGVRRARVACDASRSASLLCASPIVPGSVVRTKTPTASCGNSSQRKRLGAHASATV